MSSTWLEQTRQTLEQLELMDKAIVCELFEKMNNPSDAVITDWKISNLLNQKQIKSADSLILLTDSDKQKNQEFEILSGKVSLQEGKQPDVWINFYEKIKEMKNTHKKQNAVSVPVNSVEFIREKVFAPPNPQPEFTGEESKGKYVDMNRLFEEYINMPWFEQEQKEKMDYLEYLKSFDEYNKIEQPVKEKHYKKYKKYLENLVNYLKSYFKRVQPLDETAGDDKYIKEQFEKDWNEGNVRDWIVSNEEEEREYTQEDLEMNPLYCKYCQKLFSNENTHFNHLDGKKHKRAEKQYQKFEDKNKQEDVEVNMLAKTKEELKALKEKRKELAYLETLSIEYKLLMEDTIQNTINNIRKRQTQTGDQMEMDDFYTEDQKLLEESDEDEPIYNPKNLPIGWDGKPIPYWLYKLHGLGIEYKCEICGNYSYWGRRAYEKHFSEWRHTYGMKCLKIPNTVHFKEITSINHALQLHYKLRLESEKGKFNPDQEEEFEDTEGNIMNKKTHNDLKRQGML